MSEAIELYKRDGSPAGVFYCSECRCVFKTEAEAANCHGERLCACGKRIERRFYAQCDDCQSKDWREKSAAEEFARYNKAAKITASEYKGDMVYDSDRFYESIEEAIDAYDEGEEPEYVWACKDVGVPRASSDGIVEQLLENMWEDADSGDINGLEELDAAIAAFNEANRSIHVYQPDYKTAIIVKLTAEESR